MNCVVHLGEVILALASRLSGSGNAWPSRICGMSQVLDFVPLVPMLLVPASAWGDIYKWTDERGNTVISNIQPANAAKVSGVELLAAAPSPATQSPVAPSQQAASGTQQALEARIENLERQLQAQQSALQPQGVPQPSYAVDYYPMPAPPPLDPGYYSGYAPAYYPGYFPGYYFPSPPVYSLIPVPVKPHVRRRPGFVSRPVFVTRPPVFVGRTPVFVIQPAVSHRDAFAGGSMHRGRR